MARYTEVNKGEYSPEDINATKDLCVSLIDAGVKAVLTIMNAYNQNENNDKIVEKVNRMAEKIGEFDSAIDNISRQQRSYSDDMRYLRSAIEGMSRNNKN